MEHAAQHPTTPPTPGVGYGNPDDEMITINSSEGATAQQPQDDNGQQDPNHASPGLVISQLHEILFTDVNQFFQQDAAAKAQAIEQEIAALQYENDNTYMKAQQEHAQVLSELVRMTSIVQHFQANINQLLPMLTP